MRVIKPLFKVRSRKCYTFFLAFFWIFGLFCGIELSLYAGSSLFSLMRGGVSYSVSIVSLFLITLLPFLFSGFIMYIRSPFLLRLLCYIKGLTFGFLSAGFFAAWSDAGWLVGRLFMFSDFLSLIPLWWSWLCIGSQQNKLCFRPILIGSFISGCIVCLDFFYVSPILVKLFEY